MAITINTRYVDLDPGNYLAIVTHTFLQRKHKRYKAAPFSADELDEMTAALLDESAPEGYKATGFAVPVGSIYQREYVDQTPEEAQRAKEADLAATDAKMGRFAEDLYDALIAKGVIVPADIPQAAQDIIADRKAKRGAL